MWVPFCLFLKVGRSLRVIHQFDSRRGSGINETYDTSGLVCRREFREAKAGADDREPGSGAQAAELLPPVTRSSRNTLMTDTAGRKWIGRHWSSCARN
jgi:hypothetical protein